MSAGTHCGECGRNEQQCAVSWPCCLDCQHWLNLNDQGEPRHKRPEPTTEQRIAAAIESFGELPQPSVVEPEPDIEAVLAAPLSPYLTDPFLRELIPMRPSPKPDSGDGPSVELMRRDRARLLWEMASGESPICDLSDPMRTVAS